MQKFTDPSQAETRNEVVMETTADEVTDLNTFLDLDDQAVAHHVSAHSTACWAVAVGGTRRAYLANGGQLNSPAEYPRYMDWVNHQDITLLDHIFRLGARTVIRVMRFPRDRGGTYTSVAAEALTRLISSPSRRELHARYNMSVSVVAHTAPGECRVPPLVIDHNARSAPPSAAPRRLIYLLRGDWVDAGVEEARMGFSLGKTLGREPTKRELITGYYGLDIPPLAVYIGSGRPRTGNLLPPFIRGNEDLYWSQTPLLMLNGQDWRRIIFDHLWSRRTQGARGYNLPEGDRRHLVNSVLAERGHILGIGRRHKHGFWIADTTPGRRDGWP
ncbi:hypothetical protein ACIHFC_35970 [Streptomyces sp. NPDC052013]|uniref:hypothetical protein n=1 Tax=Streptomyces sp. NPDC052013 TaxID=3365679 RepID=UPI0037D10B21